MSRGSARTERKAGLVAVARTLGVSTTTVSNAYNRPDQLSAALRERVLRTASELGYAGPDPVARSLRRGRALAVGVVFHDRLARAFDDPAAVLFLQGFTAATDERGLAVVLVPGLPEGEAKGDAVRDAAVDGFVLHGLNHGDALIEATLGRRLPAVLVDAAQIDGFDFIGIDDAAAAATGMAHLLGLGHRRIGLLSFPLGPEPDSVARRRLAGCRRVLDGAPDPPLQECAASSLAAGSRRRARPARAASRARRCSPSATRSRSARSSRRRSAGSPCRATSRSSASTARRRPPRR